MTTAQTPHEPRGAATFGQANNVELERQACEIRLRAERRAGQLLQEMEKAKGGAEPGVGRRGNVETMPSPDGRALSAQAKLSALGLSYKQTSQWQKLADVPEEKFEEAVKQPNASTSGIIREHHPSSPKEPRKDAVEQCARIDEAADIRDKAAALQAYARQRDDVDLTVWTSEIKLRACSKIGELSRDLETVEHGGAGGGAKFRAGGISKAEALAEAGISKSTAYDYQELAGPRDEQAQHAGKAAAESYFAKARAAKAEAGRRTAARNSTGLRGGGQAAWRWTLSACSDPILLPATPHGAVAASRAAEHPAGLSRCLEVANALQAMLQSRDEPTPAPEGYDAGAGCSAHDKRACRYGSS